MKHCYFCKKDIVGEAQHCPHCGRPLEKMCVHCHKFMPVGTDFCPHCGAKTEQKIQKEKENEKAWKNFGLFILSIVIAIILTVVFAPVSIPFWYGAYYIYQQIKVQ